MKIIIKVTYVNTPKQRYIAMYTANGVELQRVIKTVEVK